MVWKNQVVNSQELRDAEITELAQQTDVDIAEKVVSKIDELEQVGYLTLPRNNLKIIVGQRMTSEGPKPFFYVVRNSL